MAGLWTFIFNHQEWDFWYGNCSKKSIEEWNADGTPSLLVGLIYAIMGSLCEIIYIPFLIVMIRKEFFQHSCYKLMFLLGVIDMIELPCNAIIAGIQCALGWHYCTSPVFNYIVGVITTVCWYGGSMTCILLGFDRFFEMCFPKLAKILFGSSLIYVWMSLPVLYMLGSMFDVPHVYNIVHHAFYFDPFIGSKGFENNPGFPSTFHTVHNIIVILCMGGVYTLLIIMLSLKYKVFKDSTFSRFQIIMTLQSMCICVEMIVAAVIYVYMQYFPISDIFVVISHVCWIMVHGDTPIVYLALNKTLRSAVFELVFRVKRQNKGSNIKPSTMIHANHGTTTTTKTTTIRTASAMSNRSNISIKSNSISPIS